MDVFLFATAWDWLMCRLGRAKPLTRAAKVGQWGERCAAAFLEYEGWTIIGTNVRPNAKDEIDIIARKRSPLGEEVIFVEVKTRKSDTFLRPMYAVDSRKRKALWRAMNAWLHKTNRQFMWRMDVIEVVGQPESHDPPKITHITNVRMR